MKTHQEMETKPYTMTSHRNQQLCVTQFFIRPPGGTLLSKLYPGEGPLRHPEKFVFNNLH